MAAGVGPDGDDAVMEFDAGLPALVPGQAPRAVLHIGLEKTGTTYLQNLLRDNADELARQGVGYPTSFGYVNHHALAAYALDAEPEKEVHRWNAVTRANQDEFRADLRRRLAAEVATRPAHTWLFSCEHLSSRLVTQEPVDRLVDLMRSCGLDPEVLVLLRPQTEMIESTWSTAVISRATAGFDVEAAVANRARYDFDAMLSRWERAVGADRVTVAAYQRNQPPGELAAAFCRLAGIDPAGLRLPEARANASLPFAQAELLLLLDQAAADTPSLMLGVRRSTLVEGLRELPGEPFRLTAEERRRIRDAYADSNAAVANRYGIDLAASAPDDPHQTARPSTFSADDVAAFLRALGRSRVRARAKPRRRQQAARRGCPTAPLWRRLVRRLRRSLIGVGGRGPLGRRRKA